MPVLCYLSVEHGLLPSLTLTLALTPALALALTRALTLAVALTLTLTLTLSLTLSLALSRPAARARAAAARVADGRALLLHVPHGHQGATHLPVSPCISLYLPCISPLMFHMGTKAPHTSLYLPISPLHLPSLMLHMGTKAHYFDSTLKF